MAEDDNADDGPFEIEPHCHRIMWRNGYCVKARPSALEAQHYGSCANRSRPVGRSVFRSKVRISVAPLMSSVTTMRSSDGAMDVIFAALGSIATSSVGALPSERKKR